MSSADGPSEDWPSKPRFRRFTLDPQGQADVESVLEKFVARVHQVEAESAKRMAESGETPTRVRIQASAFVLPKRPDSA